MLGVPDDTVRTPEDALIADSVVAVVAFPLSAPANVVAVTSPVDGFAVIPEFASTAWLLPEFAKSKLYVVFADVLVTTILLAVVAVVALVAFPLRAPVNVVDVTFPVDGFTVATVLPRIPF